MTSSPLSASRIDFRWLAIDAGSDDGGRVRFGQLVQDLVHLHNPAARTVDDRGGDWGIDTYVGELDGGRAAVWQAKYFLNGVGKSQQQQIRDSLASVLKNAKDKGFEVGAWTLCLSCELQPEEEAWWERFKKKQEKALQIPIVLWPESELRTLLQAPEAAHLRSYYFNYGGAGPRPLAAAEVPDPSAYDSALFIAQLRAAGISETSSARQQFFNAELLTREVDDKGVDDEVEELRTRRAEVHAIWENRFNAFNAQRTADTLPGLNPDVMKALEVHHNSCSPRFPPGGSSPHTRACSPTRARETSRLDSKLARHSRSIRWLTKHRPESRPSDFCGSG